MKLRRGDSRIIYLDDEGHEVEREDMLVQVQGKSISEGKAIVAGHEKTVVYEWLDRGGNPVAKSFGSTVVGIEIKPANANERRVELLRQMREALNKASAPGATQEDILESQRLQLEYHEFMALLDD